MTSTIKRWALVGAGLGMAASVSTAVVFIDLPLGSKAVASADTMAPPAVPVTVSVMKARDVSEWQEFSGRLEAVERVDLRSRVAGAVQAVHFREGSLVTKGDLLFTIDPAPYQAAVAQAQGQLDSTVARLNLAETELRRGQRLSQNRTISESVLDQRENAVAEAQAAQATAQAILHSAQLELDYTRLHAPVTGRIGRVEITVGNLVAAGPASPALTTLVSADPIYAAFDVAEEVAAQILAALPAAEDAEALMSQIPVELASSTEGAAPVKGTLQFVGNHVDMASGTIGLRAVFDNPGGKLIPGQFVRIRMGELKAEERILVSERAISTDQDKKFVYVVGPDNIVAYRPVQLGGSVEGARIIESGLAAGDQVVVNGLQRIAPGALVAPQADDVVAALK
ncbi:efflux transporter periplasmic adaptor subunit [Cereibacter changlensis JA139]|uniref:Efflux transporter periplasmic adaptor subunit n=2 Tax=Cereibacter changlensis TaxID=402884 RepID=A0A2T4JQH7_9RHOB|nr:efflux RND transporter periplasmic adaptor subunit [Cereibacter changlensis]PTE20149.1 efflux transporter periplasmic adaptor subunit [Cereibacter changlensis JA139]PZX47527.1 multidrug efflux system membrane fusion protein [Cereibacter changlensis]